MIKLDRMTRRKIKEYFKVILGYGYRCSKCDKVAVIVEASANEHAYDYVKFRCTNCKKTWVIELRKNEIKELII